MTAKAVTWKRVLLKLSGEGLKGSQQSNIDPKRLAAVTQQIAAIHQSGIQVAVVIGAGNFMRGASAATKGAERVAADVLGMKATLRNAIPLQDALEELGVKVRVMCPGGPAGECFAEQYSLNHALRYLGSNRVVIFAGGTGYPYFTTDTAAALRALEIEADVLLVAKHGVDGVYTADPKKDGSAKLIRRITPMSALKRNLQVMDSTALALCMENDLPIRVFSMSARRSIERIVREDNHGTVVATPKPAA